MNAASNEQLEALHNECEGQREEKQIARESAARNAAEVRECKQSDTRLTERETRCVARLLDPDRYPLPGEDFTDIINEALAALRRVMPLLDASNTGTEPSE